MGKSIEKYSPNTTSFIGLILCLISFCLFIINFVYYILVNNIILPSGYEEIAAQNIDFIFKIASGFLPIGLAILALGLSRHSIDLADESDKKVNSIANVNFFRVIGQIEDLRFELFEEDSEYIKGGEIITQKLMTNKRAIITWKCLTYIGEADELIETCEISVKNLNRLTHLFERYMELMKAARERINCEELDHILDMYISFFRLGDIELKNDKNYEIKNETLRKAKEHLKFLLENESAQVEIDLDYVISKKNQLSELLRQNPLWGIRNFVEIKDML